MKNYLLACAVTIAVALLPAGQSRAQLTPDLAKGKVQFARCASCHALGAGAATRIGPTLTGVVGRPAGKQEGYRYSGAMAKAAFNWTPEKLDAFLTKPAAVVPGTAMVFAGLPDPAARKVLIAYLRGVN